MKAFRLVFAATLLTLVVLPLAAQVNDTYVIPAVANTPGAYGTRWMTQLSIFNPQYDYTLNVSVTFLPTNGGSPAEVIVPVPPNGTALVDNVMDEWFDRGGSGALLVATFPEDNKGVPDEMLSRAFLVTSNTFTKTSDGGTFGQTVPGVWAGLEDFSDGISAVAHGIRNLAQYGWRTNYGAVNLGSRAVNLRINVYDRLGNTLIKNYTKTIPAQAHMQWSVPVEVDQGSIEFFVDDPSKTAVVMPSVSTLDRYTGDPAYQSPTLLATTRTLYGKGVFAAGAMPVPRKIDQATARSIRATATHRGLVSPLNNVAR